MSEKTSNLIRIPKRETAHYDAALSRQENIIGRKIEEARRAKGYSLRKLGELLHERGVDCDYQAIHKWEKGTTAPNIYQVLAVCDALEIPDAFAYFMGCGSGLNAEGMKKLLEFRDDLLASGRYTPAPAVKKSTVKYVEMPVSLLDASAGTGEFLDEENIVMMRFPESSVPVGADFALRVTGDSMEPVYQDHQLVWVQICNSLRPGEVGIFVLDGAGYIKAYDEQEPDEDELDNYTDSNGVVHYKPVLISYNEKYAPRPVLPSSRFKICGRVLN